MACLLTCVKPVLHYSGTSSCFEKLHQDFFWLSNRAGNLHHKTFSLVSVHYLFSRVTAQHRVHVWPLSSPRTMQADADDKESVHFLEHIEKIQSSGGDQKRASGSIYCFEVLWLCTSTSFSLHDLTLLMTSNMQARSSAIPHPRVNVSHFFYTSETNTHLFTFTFIIFCVFVCASFLMQRHNS